MLPQLEAERQLASIEAASAPYMNAEAARAMFAKYMSMMGEEQRPRRATLDDLAAFAGVRRVPKKKTEEDG